MPRETARIDLGNVVKTLDKIRDISQLDPATRKQLVSSVDDLKTGLQDLETERNGLLTTLNENKTTIASLQAENSNLKRDSAAKDATIEDLKKKLAAATSPPQGTKPLDLANSFKSVVDRIQQEALQSGGMATTVKSMDLELKVLVNQKDQDVLVVLPTPTAPIDPNQLSTLRVSFGAVPGVAPPAAAAPRPSIVPEAAPAAPPAPAQPAPAAAAPKKPAEVRGAKRKK
ncbi:MAG TPA: hypothetical protein VFD30_10775 [Terriglobia bacterium]|nr:hypothetical protein [Terriglobia bacterium]